MKIEIIGIPAMQRRFGQAADGLRGDALMPALRSAALLVQNRAKQLAPARTGNLRRSIHIKNRRRQRSVVVGTNVVYARRIEYGFAGMDSLGRRFHQPAQPYLRPALETQRNAVIHEFEAALGQLLKGAMR